MEKLLPYTNLIKPMFIILHSTRILSNCSYYVIHWLFNASILLNNRKFWYTDACSYNNAVEK